MDQVVIVGASLAGFRAAEELRVQGFDGTITLVGDEPHPPYDRPPLSKQVLAGTQPPEAVVLEPVSGTVDELALDRRHARATGLDLAAREVGLDGGERLPFDGLVVATGARPRTLPAAGDRASTALEGIHTLRTLDDALAIRRAVLASPRRVAVVGAGFIGAEVAATCRSLGVEVTLLEALDVPLERTLGPAIGAVIGEVHADHGVDVRLGVGVAELVGADRVERVVLASGETVDVDLVVVGIGVTPNTQWLEGSGVELDDGVVCDETCLVAPGVVAAGDVARWPNRRFAAVEDRGMRVEHWDNATEMGPHAARTLLADAAGGRGEPFQPIPWFWSDQYDRKLQLAGRCGPGDEVAIVAGSTAERRFAALFGRRGQVVGAFGMNMPAKVMRWRSHVEAGTAWEDALAAVAAE